VEFKGIPPGAFEFFERLEADNTKSFWEANKSTYADAVRGPMEALADEVDPAFGPLRLFRPYRDVRFSKDKTPYKTACGAVGEDEGGCVYYVQVSAAGLGVATGMYHMATDQLARFRDAVGGDHGAELEPILASLRKAGYDVGADSLKTAPRGWPRDHPRIELLRLKGLTAWKQHAGARWLHTSAAKKRIEQVWLEAAPMNKWLSTHVGPSELPPDDLR